VGCAADKPAGSAHHDMAATALRGLDKVTGGACLFALTYNICASSS
jgi:hypothetical protein